MRLRKKYTQPTPPWITWGVIALLALAFGSQALHPNTAGQANWNLFSMDTYKSRLLPVSSNSVQDIAPGEGEAALCGQEVEFGVRPVSDVPADTTEQTEQLQHGILGSADMPAALQKYMIGMKPGGIRDVRLPPEKGAVAGGHYAVRLVSAAPPVPAPDSGMLPLKMVDTRVGTLQTVHCGDAVRVRVTLWNAEGHAFYSPPEPLAITVGETPLPLGLTQGISGMQRGGARIVILPPAYLSPLRSADTPVIPMPETTTTLTIAEIEVLP